MKSKEIVLYIARSYGKTLRKTEGKHHENNKKEMGKIIWREGEKQYKFERRRWEGGERMARERVKEGETCILLTTFLEQRTCMPSLSNVRQNVLHVM